MYIFVTSNSWYELNISVWHQEKELHDSRTQLKTLATSEDKLKKSLQVAESTSERYRKEHEDSSKKITQFEREINTFRRDMSVLEKGKKALEMEMKNREVKLNRAIQEAERYKNQAKQEKEKSVRTFIFLSHPLILIVPFR